MWSGSLESALLDRFRKRLSDQTLSLSISLLTKLSSVRPPSSATALWATQASAIRAARHFESTWQRAAQRVGSPSRNLVSVVVNRDDKGICEEAALHREGQCEAKLLVHPRMGE